jgi:hypothetical protein
VARNASGVYSLPSLYNPVVTRTTILTDWANTTLNDIRDEITLSLDRSGRGAMTAPLQLPDGTAALPALTFSGDTNTGAYRVGANSLGFSTDGVNRMTVNISDVTVAASQLLISVGGAGAPALAFANDADCGLYRAGADDIRFAVGGAEKMKWTAAGVNIPTVDGAMTVNGALTINAALAATGGLTVTQSASNTIGATITGNGSAFGALITGGATGPGADIRAGGGNSSAIVVTGAGTGITADIQAGGTTGYGLVIQPNTTRAAMRLIPIAGDPSSLSDGDVWYNSTTGKLRVRAAGVSVDLH